MVSPRASRRKGKGRTSPEAKPVALGDIVAWRSADGWHLGKVTGRSIAGWHVVPDSQRATLEMLREDELHVVDGGRRSEFDALRGRLGGHLSPAQQQADAKSARPPLPPEPVFGDSDSESESDLQRNPAPSPPRKQDAARPDLQRDQASPPPRKEDAARKRMTIFALERALESDEQKRLLEEAPRSPEALERACRFILELPRGAGIQGAGFKCATVDGIKLGACAVARFRSLCAS